MRVHPLSLEIRMRKLGLLIRNARETAGKTISESAAYLQIPEESFRAFEEGLASPSLPQLEALADFYQTPLDHFWSSQLLEADHASRNMPDLATIQALRQRIIGALVRKSRLEKGKSIKDVAEELGIQAESLERYELGEEAIPLPVLEALSLTLGNPMDIFFDRETPLGKKAAQQDHWANFQELPEELRDFVVKPINRPYLELAQRLSEMSVEKLRAVAEGLLEITL